MTAPTPQAPDLLSEALAALARGWSLVPLNGKVPVLKGWQQAPAATPDEVRQWVAEGRNLGVRTGGASGVIVIDVDADEAAATAALSSLPATWTCRTGSGGAHLYFQAPSEPLGNRCRCLPDLAARLGVAFDLRAAGGQCVLAGSRHPDTGRIYAWESGRAPGDVPLAELPAAWLAELTTRPAAPPPAPAPTPRPATTPSDRRVSAYLQAALDGECRAVAATAEGGRNHQLNASAFSCGTLINQGLREDDVTAALLAAAAQCGLPEGEARATIRSGLTAGQASPRQIPEPEHDQAPEAVPAEDCEFSADEPAPGQSADARPGTGFDATCEGSEEWFARNFARRFAGKLAYVRTAGAWYAYQEDEGRWRKDETGALVMQAARAMIDAVLGEAQDTMDAARSTSGKQAKQRLIDRAGDLLKIGRTFSARRPLENALALAQTAPALAVRQTDFDNDPWALNVANGTVDLRTGELLPHDPARRITRLAPVTYDPGARLDLWDRFLSDAVELDVAEFLARAIGYTLTGDCREEVLFLMLGDTATGKSTFLEAVRATLGDYAKHSDFETFLARPATGSPRNDVARLVGARLVTASETEQGGRLAEALVKTLTGNETISARYLYAEAFEFRPEFKLWLGCNHAPRASADDGALWRRILRVPFERQVPPAKRDPAVKATLRTPAAAGPAILAWAVRGCLDWQAHGLRVPARIAGATDALRREMDTFADFMADCCILDPAAWTATSALRQAYEQWAKDRGDKHLLGGNRFAERLKLAGCEPEQRPRLGGRGWRGIGLAGTTGTTGTGISENSPHARAYEGSFTKPVVPPVPPVSMQAADDHEDPEF